MINRIRVVPAVVVAVLVTLLGTQGFHTYQAGAGVTGETEHHAVLLDNGSAYFGRLEKLGSAYPVLTEVYYVRNQVNQETKEVTNTLIKRGQEWHAPGRMILNADHILFVEPVTPGSTVAKLIEEEQRKR